MARKSSYYLQSGNRHLAEIGGRKVWVDSLLEARVLRELEATGFAERWRRLDRGISYRGSRYTPDFELAIERDNGTHRALVEVKPSVGHFQDNQDLIVRMLGVAGYYKTDYFLLYVGNERAWYQIDVLTGTLTPFVDLTPGKLRINQLHEPFRLPTWRVYDHHYSARPEIGRQALKLFTGALETFLMALFHPPKKRRRYRRK